MSKISEQVTKIVDTDSTLRGASVIQRGSKGAQTVEIVDSSGNQITNFGQGANSSVGDGNVTVTSAGTAVQLSSTSIPCKRVIVHAVTGHIVVGGSDVFYDASYRKGRWIAKTQEGIFLVNNVNLLYADAAKNGTLISYYYEN